jgi:hypothetical protein
MINHIRTLILNERSGAEFISDTFAPMPATAAAGRVRDCLFAGLSAETKDARMQQVMQLLHTYELEPYVLAKDPRVTYLPFGSVAQPGSLVAVAEQLHARLTAEDEGILFDGVPEFLTMWHSDKLLFDLAGILLALAYHADKDR